MAKVKKKIKEEIRKPDIFTRTISVAFEFVRANVRLFVIGAVVFCVGGLSAYGYAVFKEKKNEKAQMLVSEGIKSLEEFNVTGKKEELDKAEGIFSKVVKEKPGKVYLVAKLYLGSAYALKGQTDDARKTYQELAKESPAVLRMLSESALRNLNTK
jgi:hypothetical protein